MNHGTWKWTMDNTLMGCKYTMLMLFGIRMRFDVHFHFSLFTELCTLHIEHRPITVKLSQKIRPKCVCTGIIEIYFICKISYSVYVFMILVIGDREINYRLFIHCLFVHSVWISELNIF